MSEEMAIGDNASIEEAKLNGDEAAPASAVDAEAVTQATPQAEAEPEVAPVEDAPALAEVPEVKDENTEDVNMAEPEQLSEKLVTVGIDDGDEKRGIKRRASTAFSDAGKEDFKGFETGESKFESSYSLVYSRIVDRLEAEVSAAVKDHIPLRSVMATPSAPLRASKRPRQDTGEKLALDSLAKELSEAVEHLNKDCKENITPHVKKRPSRAVEADGSRPSSALSSRSDGDGVISTDTTSAPRARRVTTEMGSPLLRAPLERGWRRELVYRAALDAHARRNADIYYYTPKGKKLRSTREVSEHLSGTGLTLENFSFFKEPLGLDDPEKEIIRDAKMIRRVESPVAAAEGKRAPKPKPPKGASPEPSLKSPPAKIKVKSVGSRLSTSSPSTPAANNTKQQKKATDNNNSAAWKKPSDDKKRGKVANGAASPPAVLSSPRRRGRPKVDDTDHFTAFYSTAQERNYNVVVQIFQYLGMRELAQCARVCRLWRQLAAAPALWRHVRMKNSHVSDWGGLCAALKRHGTKRLDLRKMLLPQNDVTFWDQFAQHIGEVDSLERIEMCRCPARAVEAVCSRLSSLRALSALAIRDARLDPAPLSRLTLLHELRLKSMAGLTLTRDLRPLAQLKALQHLSLTSIKDLGWCLCDVVGQLPQLQSLELGECTFSTEFASAVRGLSQLRRLRLERGTAHCAASAILRSLALLPLLTSLELVNIDVKVGFDDALAECKNIQRLLIIPTYVSQSATTNKQVLSGVLRLKETLTHLMWGVTIELLRVTELFIDQCEPHGGGGGGGDKRRDVGECIPVLKPVPGCRLPEEHHTVAGPPQVEILPLPTLQRLLSAQLPHTKLKLLRIPFHATWRQSLADFQ
ncbi:uncharacterized protein LOC128679891 isoform X2 [Plodia interpunctella]|uniref:uncharacterized protein LOC128679891 isoform X2 n=1 Tax=Plodia interpunctella TaxID=58824 RepID=UPI002367E2C6|nr:uncharacterized protein LOC128679891 isoform X2 [Plodia interpunctella]